MDSTEALIKLILIGGMILLFTGGGVAILMAWYLRGRDPHTGLIADIISEPPDDLPPGAVGTLLDERADHEDVVATLVGLGRAGAVSISLECAGRGADWTITSLHPQRVKTGVERDLLNLIFDNRPEPLREVRLRDVRPKFVAAEERIRDDLYRELVQRGYFAVSPVETRRRWRVLSYWGIGVSLVLGILGMIVLDPLAIAPMVAAVVMWAVMARMSRHMPRKTAKGAEAAAKWRAFRRYLQDIRQHRDLGASSEIFDRYLSYAIAMGIDKEWIRSFADAGARTPGWLGAGGGLADAMGDVVIVDGGLPDLAGAGDLIGNLGRVGDVSFPDAGLPDVGVPDMPDVQVLSDMLGGSLQGASDGLFDLLDAAGSIFDAIDFDIGS